MTNTRRPVLSLTCHIGGCFLLLVLSGCGGHSNRSLEGVDEQTQRQIAEYLQKSGINNPIAAARDMGDFWLVSLEPEAPTEQPTEDETVTISTGDDTIQVFKSGEVKRGTLPVSSSNRRR